MIEHENVKDALKEAIEMAELETNGIVIELIRERLYNIADLLGMSEIYLNKEKQK